VVALRPGRDTLFEQQAAEFGKQAGVQVQVERINQNDIQARVTAAVQAQTGPDIIIIANNHPLLYETALADVSDVAEEIGRRQGGWYDYAKVNTVASGAGSACRSSSSRGPSPTARTGSRS
jgi:multiple sugar transport system substrate-binding protein